VEVVDLELPVDGVHRGEEEDSVTVVDEEDLAGDAVEVDSVEVVGEVAASRGVDPVEAVAEEALVDVDEDTRPWLWLFGFQKQYEGCRELSL
jgi:hypothetical protein